MEKKVFDLIIIGAGPAGLTAGIYAARRELKTLIISKNLGGQAILSHEIENYPGLEAIDGVSLIHKFSRQALEFGAEMKYGEVVEIKKNKNIFIVQDEKNESYKAKTVILALGLSPKKIEVPGETKLTGKGVCYCATCDGPLYRNKEVAVIGGGNSALGAARYLSEIAKKVYLIHRRPEFRGEAVAAKALTKKENVKILLSTEILEVKGQNFVEGLLIKNNQTNKISEIPINGIFVEIGYITKTEFIKDLIKLNDKGEIITDQKTKTSVEGIFACGDTTEIEDKQIIISAGQGAQAALQAYKYIKEKTTALLPDWE